MIVERMVNGHDLGRLPTYAEAAAWVKRLPAEQRTIGGICHRLKCGATLAHRLVREAEAK